MRHTIVNVLLLLFAAGAAAFARAEAFVAGDLPRRAALGFVTEVADGKVRIARVDEGSPAAAAGLRDGDQVVSIGGTPVTNALDGQDRLRRALGDAVLHLSVARPGGPRRHLSFTPPPRPLEQMPGIDSFYDAVDVGGAKLRTIVAAPAGSRGQLPAVLFTQWVSCGSIEYNPQSAWRRALADFVRANGVALVRVERSSDGDSEGPACHRLDYDSEVRHYVAAFDRLLASNPRLDRSRVFIVGSSLGSTTAPLVGSALQARGHRILGVSVQGGGAVTYFERMLNFERFYLERRPEAVQPHQIHGQMMRRIRFLHEYLIAGRSPDEIGRDNADMAAVRADIRGLGAGEHYGRPYAWHQQAAKRNFLEAWAALKARVLVVFGAYDQFEAAHGHEVIATMVNRLRPGTARYVQLERTDHNLMVHRTIEDAYADADGAVSNNKAYFDELTAFVRRALK